MATKTTQPPLLGKVLIFGGNEVNRILNLLLIVLSVLSLKAEAKTPWAVGVVFLGSAENEDYQKDMDRNILELARSFPNENYSLSIYREFKDRNVEFFVGPKSEDLAPWDDLFSVKPQISVKVPGQLRSWKKRVGEKSIISEPVQFARFADEAFKNKKAKRILLLYSHGQAFDGLGGKISLKELRETLEEYTPKRPGRPLDLLWLDACFMANLEVAYELRNVSQLMIASEEAEFSAGAPFEMFRQLSYGPDSLFEVAANFHAHFLESYSYLKKGSQSKAVFKSSATLSVIDLRRVEKLATKIQRLVEDLGELTDEQRKILLKKTKKYKMEKGEVTDLGQLLLLLSSEEAFRSSGVKAIVERLRNDLDVGAPEKFQTSPRIILDPIKPSERLVFGYEDWTKGFRGDADSLERLPQVLERGIETFVSGAHQKEWPLMKVPEVLYFSPFSVGLNKFHSYVIDKSTQVPTSSTKTFERLKDFVIFKAESAENPLLLSGFTQGIGEDSERYTGLSILSPGAGLPGLDYGDLEFHTLTGWGNL